MGVVGLGERRRGPPRRVVLVDDHRAHAFVEIRLHHAEPGEAVFQRHAVLEVEAGAGADLAKGDAGFVLIRREDIHREAFTLRREYLTAAPRGLAAGNPWFCEYGPELSRGFRALKVWFHLKEHGIRRIAEKVEDNCRQAAYLGELVNTRPELELSTPVSLNICCFRFVASDLTDTALNRINEEIVMDLQESGVAAPSTTKLNGVLAIRVNITNHRSTMADFDLLVNEVVKLGRALVERV